MGLDWAVRGWEGRGGGWDLEGTKLGTRGSWSSSAQLSSDKETKKTGKLLFAPGSSVSPGTESD